jgi:hypothetical protein
MRTGQPGLIPLKDKERFMNFASPRLKILLLGCVGLCTFFFWYFDWAVWAITAAVIGAIGYFGGLTSRGAEADDSGQAVGSSPCVTAQPDSGPFESAMTKRWGRWAENDEVRGWQLEFESLWKGKKSVEFAYRDKGRGSFSAIHAEVTEVISPDFEGDEEIYFKGTTTAGEHRYFCLRYVKGRKVTDAESGDVGTLQKIFGLKRRIYR